MFYLIDAFNVGFRIQLFFPGAKQCQYKAQDFLNEINTTVNESTEEALQSDTYEFFRNYTRLISDEFAQAYLHCHMTVVDVYDYVLIQEEIY